MLEKKLHDNKSQVATIHSKVSVVFQNENIPTDMRKEYRGKCSQYINMLESLENMQSEAETDEAREGLINQELSVIKTWSQFELEILQRVANL